MGDAVPVDVDPQEATDGDGQFTTDQPVEDAPPREYLDLDSARDRYVRVKVDGEDVEVPLGEALSGYSRTADYTRKTQELAAQRQQAEHALAVQRALQAQPAMALQLLAQQYGVTLPSQTQPASPADEDFDFGGADRYQDPMERRLAQIEQQNQQLAQQWQQRQADEQLRQAVSGLQQRYGIDDGTVREVVGTALQQGMGPEAFDMIYKNIAFDRAAVARQQAVQQQANRQAQRQQAGQQAASAISNGGSASMAGTSAASRAAGPLSISEAWDMAAKELGVDL
jgi:hypothetical protein